MQRAGALFHVQDPVNSGVGAIGSPHDPASPLDRGGAVREWKGNEDLFAYQKLRCCGEAETIFGNVARFGGV